LKVRERKALRKRWRSSMGEISLQGIGHLPMPIVDESVTHVPG